MAAGAAALSLLSLLPAAVPSRAGEGSALGRDLDAILRDGRLSGARAGLVVRNADTGAVLYSRDSATREQPASNGKLLSSAAALEVLGPDYRFGTTVATDGVRHGAVLDGNLYLRGTGDPTMLAGDYADLAAQVAASGIRTVRGDLVADDTWFDDVRLAPGWAWDDEPYYYDAQISALTIAPDTDYDAGSVIVRVAPAAAGQPATVTLDPPTDDLRVENGATTGAPGSASTVSVDREHGGNTIRVTGSVPAGAAADQEYLAVWNPTAFVASVFRRALAEHGVRVAGRTGYRATPAGARTLAGHESMPLSRLLVPFLKLSNNIHAETLVKAAGRKVSGQGSWDAGTRALAGALGGLGVDAAALLMVDGSGLSRMDQVAPDDLAALLLGARGKPWFAAWYDALPIAGDPDRMVGGTLRNRMVGTPAAGNVHAKTGSYTGVSALSGYVTAADGEKLVFSLVENNALVGGSGVRPLEDAVAVRLATYRGADDRSQPHVPAPRSGGPADGAGTRSGDLECTWVRTC
jgi:D-alanyl-D-alanine carboxypeptidase/D-alanyl-D-alanine-endopeptidase (penicillin-binding protein 4)